MHKTTLETERFLLRPLTTQDVTERYRSWFNPETARMGIASARRQPTIEELKTFIAERVSREDVFFFGIFTKDGGEHIGNLKYEPVDSQEGYAVMGILIGQKEWWGKGVAPEVLRATARWLRDRFHVREIILGVMKDNLLARRSYEKVGFRLRHSDRIGIDLRYHEAMIWRLDEVSP